VVVETETDSRLLLIAGKPLGEPIVQQGRFVMSTQEEIANVSARGGLLEARLRRSEFAMTHYLPAVGYVFQGFCPVVSRLGLAQNSASMTDFLPRVAAT
jgi:hypothetical protein